MKFLGKKNASPEFARIAPYVVFVVLTFFQELGPEARFWMYLIKSIIGAWMIWEARDFVAEMRWKMSAEAVLVGIAIFGVWVGLDGLYPRLTTLGEGWNPRSYFGPDSAMAWFFVVVRVAGSSLVVPPIEEILFRSFLYRWFVKLDFLAMPLGRFHPLSFLVTSTIFGLLHPDRWLAGILCGLAYQWLVVRKDRLGDAITAHAITNFLLGLWVVWNGAWDFW